MTSYVWVAPHIVILPNGWLGALEAPAIRPTPLDGDDSHQLFCACSPGVSLCGLDIGDLVINENADSDGDCGWCVAMFTANEPCPGCGHGFREDCSCEPREVAP